MHANQLNLCFLLFIGILYVNFVIAFQLLHTVSHIDVIYVWV